MFVAEGLCRSRGLLQQVRDGSDARRALEWQEVGGPAHAEPFQRQSQHPDRGVLFVGRDLHRSRAYENKSVVQAALGERYS